MSTSRTAQALPSGDSASADVAASAPAEKLTLEEMIRIMDVATTLRKEQELVEQQLNLEETKALLKKRLLEAAEVTGETLTDEQIDIAIEHYYDKLHCFEEPKWSFKVLLAHLYVCRGMIARWVLGIAAAVALVWSLLAAGILPGEARTRHQVEQLYSQIQRKGATIGKLTDDVAVREELEKLLAPAAEQRDQLQPQPLAKLLNQLTKLQTELDAEYQLVIVDGPNEKSGTERKFTDAQRQRTSGFYVFVEARNRDGSVRPMQIRNRETDKLVTVRRWGEQVPEAVFNVLATDKQLDGVLDERLFGEKVRGEREITVKLTGEDGQPLARQGQITSW